LPRELGPLIRTYVNYLLLSRFAPTGLQLRTRLGEIFAAAHSEAESARAPTRGVFKGTRSDDESLSPNREIERTLASESLRRVERSRTNGRETRPRESRTCPEPAAAYLLISIYLPCLSIERRYLAWAHVPSRDGNPHNDDAAATMHTRERARSSFRTPSLQRRSERRTHLIPPRTTERTPEYESTATR